MIDRKIGTHTEHNCNGAVHFRSSGSYGERYCKKCGQSSHNFWTHPIFGVRMSPTAPGYLPTGEKTKVPPHKTVGEI